MAYSLLFGERPADAARSARRADPLRAFGAWIAAVRARRARRVALTHLLDFDAALLDDLGISREDVLEALQHPEREAGRALSARRARASRAWLNQL